MTNQEEDITQLDADSCARCGERQRDVPHLTFKINNTARCGHKFCSSCIDRELYSKRQFECPKCKSMVSQDKLTIKTMDETEVERDYSIRRKLSAIFNKREADFSSINDFKNYEEMVEDIIYNLVNYIDVEKTNRQVEQYKSQYRNEIIANEKLKAQQWKEESSDIKRSQESILKSDIAFGDNYRKELLVKKEAKRQINAIRLGEGDPTMTQSSLPALMADESSNAADPLVTPSTLPNSAVNPVVAFLASREEPKLLSTLNHGGLKAVRSNADLRKMHQAGGYDFSEYERKNFSELVYLLSQIRKP